MGPLPHEMRYPEAHLPRLGFDLGFGLGVKRVIFYGEVW